LLQCTLWTVAQGTWPDKCQERSSDDVLHHWRHLVLGNALCIRSNTVEQELGNLSRFVGLLSPFPQQLDSRFSLLIFEMVILSALYSGMTMMCRVGHYTLLYCTIPVIPCHALQSLEQESQQYP